MICVTCAHENSQNAKFCSACGSELDVNAPAGFALQLAKGTRLQNGAYAVGEVLGQGGFGITYRGGDFALRRYVAIKEFFPQGCLRRGTVVAPTSHGGEYEAARAKFLEEARTLARFSHPSIVRVFGVFEENNSAYMVMDFLEGTTLQKLIESGPLPEEVAVGYIRPIAEALQQVHATGLIHRDIKPDNICITKDSRPVLIDFGTARQFTTDKTVRHTAMLTPGYAPLEQYGQQARFGAFTDVYALGATLYHCLTGQMPASATDRANGVELPAPDQLNPLVSGRISRAVMYALQMKAALRPRSANEFVAALEGAPVSPATAPGPRPDPFPAFDSAKGKVLTVAPAGSFESIGAAIAVANEGDCILISSGVYRENLKIDKGVHLVGNGRVVVEWGTGNVCRIEGGRGSVQGIVFHGDAGLEGKRFYAVNVLAGEWDFQRCEVRCDTLAAFRVGGTAQVALRGCQIKSDKLDGVLLDGGQRCQLFDSALSGNGRHGLHQKEEPLQPTCISGCHCEKNGGNGVLVSKGRAALDGCHLSLNRRAGAELEGTSHAEIKNCHINNNAAQGVIAGVGATGQMAACQVTGNRFGAFDIPASSGFVRLNIQD